MYVLVLAKWIIQQDEVTVDIYMYHLNNICAGFFSFLPLLSLAFCFRFCVESNFFPQRTKQKCHLRVEFVRVVIERFKCPSFPNYLSEFFSARFGHLFLLFAKNSITNHLDYKHKDKFTRCTVFAVASWRMLEKVCVFCKQFCHISSKRTVHTTQLLKIKV